MYVKTDILQYSIYNVTKYLYYTANSPKNNTTFYDLPLKTEVIFHV